MESAKFWKLLYDRAAKKVISVTDWLNQFATDDVNQYIFYMNNGEFFQNSLYSMKLLLCIWSCYNIEVWLHVNVLSVNWLFSSIKERPMNIISYGQGLMVFLKMWLNGVFCM